MLLKTNDGIGCDLCGAAEREKFTYYSITYKGIVVKSGSVATGDIEWDSEVCKKCYDALLDKCRECLASVRPNQIKCDLCVNFYGGDIKYYKMNCDEVNVDRDANPNVSIKKQVMDMNICTPCYTKYKNRLGDNNAV